MDMIRSTSLDDLLERAFSPIGFPIGYARMGYTSSDTEIDGVEKYIQNPEWEKKMLEQQIDNLDKKEGHYQAQIDHLISVQGSITEQKEELKKKLKSLDISK